MIDARPPRWLVLVCLVLLLAAVGYYVERGLSQTRKHERDRTYHRDFDHFYHAAIAGAGGEDPYESFRRGYIYPPLIAAMFRPLAGLERNTAYLIWFGVNAAILAAAFVLSARTLLRRLGVQPRAPTVLCVVVGGLAPAFDQTRWQLEQGQTDGLVLLSFALGLHWLDRRPLLAGIATGGASNIKYISLIVLPYAILRRRARLAAGVVGGAIAGLVVPAAVFGWDRNADFVRKSLGRLVHVVDSGPDLQGTGGANVHSLTWELNISLPAFAAKAVNRLGLPEAWVPILAAGLASLLVLIAWRLYRRRGFRFWVADARPATRGRLGTFEWLGLIVCAMALSPQTTVRHMILLTMVYQCAVVLAIVQRGPKRYIPVAGVIVAFLGATLPPGGGGTWSSEVALPIWRSVSGAMWCALACYACVLWSGLAWAHSVQRSPGVSSLSDGGRGTPM
ncbi:MAG: glycosyltransferase family 87 protein [Planctomycetota bacterium]